MFLKKKCLPYGNSLCKTNEEKPNSKLLLKECLAVHQKIEKYMSLYVLRLNLHACIHTYIHKCLLACLYKNKDYLLESASKGLWEHMGQPCFIGEDAEGHTASWGRVWRFPARSLWWGPADTAAQIPTLGWRTGTDWGWVEWGRGDGY